MAEWGMDVKERTRWIAATADLGVTTFDHADIYGDYQVEALFGEALATDPGLRHRVQLVTKCGIRLISSHRPAHRIKSYDTSRQHIVESVEASLRALRTEFIDLLLLHRPDFLLDPDEVTEAFLTLHEDGKVLHLGVSNHSPSQFALLHHRLPLATNQVELSPLQLTALADGTLDQCREFGVRPMTWSPLAGGRLATGRDAEAQRVQGVLRDIGRERGVSAATVAYAWNLRHPSRPVPLTGTRRVAAIREAVDALRLTLTREEWYRIWQAGAGHEVP